MHCTMDSQLTVRLPADLTDALARASRKSGRRNSDIVRAALREYLNAAPLPSLRPAERVRTLIGSVDSGLADLAEQHREYLIESLARDR
jgi:metal-responsive CopG/Arc/MetJ family transcriptional regulator